jgi:hypothetical protein
MIGVCRVAGSYWQANAELGMSGLAPDEPLDPPRELRERATRVRRYAQSLLNDEASPRLLAYADELDALAEAAEAGN